ncbi:hypothetical protein ERJ75_000932700 [Trypanosoma vivax]|nr:hypothetical protein ERJ75_000932700 [Trypanosoma vivax]
MSMQDLRAKHSLNGLVKVFDPNFKCIYLVPVDCVVHVPPARLNISRLVVCRNYAPGATSSCSKDESCRFVHADVDYSTLESFSIHVNYVWRNESLCTYERLPPGDVLDVLTQEDSPSTQKYSANASSLHVVQPSIVALKGHRSTIAQRTSAMACACVARNASLFTHSALTLTLCVTSSVLLFELHGDRTHQVPFFQRTQARRRRVGVSAARVKVPLGILFHQLLTILRHMLIPVRPWRPVELPVRSWNRPQKGMIRHVIAFGATLRRTLVRRTLKSVTHCNCISATNASSGIRPAQLRHWAAHRLLLLVLNQVLALQRVQLLMKPLPQPESQHRLRAFPTTTSLHTRRQHLPRSYAVVGNHWYLAQQTRDR